LGAAAGGSLSSIIAPEALQLAASVGFLILGTRLILRSNRTQDPPTEAVASGSDTPSP